MLHKTFSAAHTAVVRIRPSAGINAKAISRTPITAPNVLLAYKAAMDRCGVANRAVSRSIAGTVAPIAAVAGRSRANVPQNATVHCHNGLGAAPVIWTNNAPDGDIANANRRLQPAITASHAAYHRTGRAALSMRGPSTHAPTAIPPKNAAITASIAADSWPNHRAHCWVQTIWYPKPAKPDASISASEARQRHRSRLNR